MNLSTKAVTLLVLINSLEYSTAEDDMGCGTTEALGVISCAIGTSLEAEDKDKHCCHQYYTQCLVAKLVREKCSPSSKWTDEVKAQYKETLKLCTPTKELCAKYHKDVEKKCGEYDYSECKSYTWSSFTPISVNGWPVCLLILISAFFVV